MTPRKKKKRSTRTHTEKKKKEDTPSKKATTMGLILLLILFVLERGSGWGGCLNVSVLLLPTLYHKRNTNPHSNQPLSHLLHRLLHPSTSRPLAPSP